MTAREEHDPDQAPGAGRMARLHLSAGRVVVSAVNLVRPRVTMGVRLMAFDAKGRVFLVRHTYVPGYHLPGGGVGPGETVREAALREAAEEGALVCDGPLELFGIYLNLALARRDHVVLLVNRSAAAGTGRSGGLEVIEKGFFMPDALPSETTRATRARIEEVLSGRTQSETW